MRAVRKTYDTGTVQVDALKGVDLTVRAGDFVAIARALACDPTLVLADEPTGNLDSASGKDVLHLFEELGEQGRTMLVITHDMAVAARTRRLVRIADGEIVEDRSVVA